MSSPPRDPEFINTDDILPIPRKFQVRGQHSPEEVRRTAIDIQQKTRLTKPIRVVPISSLYPTEVEKYKGKFALVGGTKRLVALMSLKVKQLRVGKDVYVEKDIHDLKKYSLEVWHDNDLDTPLSWVARVKQAKVWKEEFGWTQEEIAKEMGIESQATISKYLTIANNLPLEVIDDPFIESLGLTKTLALSKMFAKGERDGREMLQRLKEQHGDGTRPSGVPSEKRMVEIASDYEKTGRLDIALGSQKYDRSRYAERTDTIFREWAKEAQEQAIAPPPFSSFAELVEAKGTLETLKKNTSVNPAHVSTLEMITAGLKSFVNGDWSPGEPKAVIERTVYALDGLVKDLKEQKSKHDSSGASNRPFIGEGIRLHFEPGERQ